MIVKIVAAVAAVALMLAFLGPLMLKMKDLPLGIIMLIGIGMMLADLWQSLQSQED